MAVLKKFISYYKPYKTVFFIDMLCAIIISIIDLAYPQLLNLFTKNLGTLGVAEILRSVQIIAPALLVLYILQALCQYYVTCRGHIMGAQMESDMRRDLFDQFQRLSFSYYDRNNTGIMMSKLISDLFDISELAHHGPENLLISVLKIIGSFALLLYVNVPMTLILLCVTAAMIIFSVFQNKKMRLVFMDNRKKIAQVNARILDSLSGIRVVKSFANEDVEREKFDASNTAFLDSKKSSYRRMGVYHSGNHFFQGMMFATVLLSGGFFIAAGQITPMDLALYALYINIFISPVNVLINFTELFQKGYSGFKRFLGVVETIPEIQDKPDAAELPDVTGNIEFKNVSFSYDDEEIVLRNIDLKIKAGKTVALVGSSGSGKTTLCSLIPRFYDVSDGSITIDGYDVRDVTTKSLREAVGIVQQDVYIFSGTIRDNIEYGKPGATAEEIIAAAKNANIHDFIMSLKNGYDTFVGERGVRLSGGQKQRLSIARVFLKNPRILVLDEATSALDNESERYIQKSLEHLSANRTTIVIAHRLSTIRNADEIVVIDEESLAERGTHEELLNEDGIYARYYNMQFGK